MEPIHDSKAAGLYLETLINLERRPDLSNKRMNLGPIRALLDRLGKPDQGLRVVHVAGSKGKGSVCLFAESSLLAAGKRTGVFTSPHLHSWTERFRLCGEPVESGVLASAVSRLRPHVEWLREHDPINSPTFFDATTAAALLIFAEANLDIVILEVGLGGRLDSTNIVSPEATCITSIELEHTDKLGDTIEAIAGEKAGIIKPGVPCYIGALPPGAEAVVRTRAASLGAPVLKLGDEIEVVGQGELQVLGEHQVGNASLALAIVAALNVTDPGDLASIRRGLAAAKLPGRMELLSEKPWVMVDGAHTGASARALAKVLAANGVGRTTLLLSVSADKDLEAIFSALLPVVDDVVVTCADPHRSMPAKALASLLIGHRPDLTVRTIADPSEAASEALKAAREGSALVAAGSIYLAAVALNVWRDGVAKIASITR
jgi:dihydrofolate synthase/folylpolyglutamate synthase